MRTCAANVVKHTSFNPLPTRPADKELHGIERAKRRIWLREGRPQGMNHPSYRKYKRAKRLYRITHDKENTNYMCKVYADVDKAAELDVRPF